MFLGPFGFLAADRAARAAAERGRPRERYWICWLLVWTTLTPILYGVLAFALLVGVVGVSLSSLGSTVDRFQRGGSGEVVDDGYGGDGTGEDSSVQCTAPDGSVVYVTSAQCVGGRYTP